jgi:AcrR family transcriptional regulator
MVEKKRSRGRPRAYDPEAALDRAAELFWAQGFAATSLDELGEAMDMGRPSIYHAFGDKEALFLQALERFRDTTGATPMEAMEREAAVGDGLAAFFRQIVAYTTADRTHRGCLIGSVATATDLPAVQRFLRANLKKTEAQIADRLATAVRSGQLPADYAAADGARRAVNAMLSLAARARLGTSRAELLADAEAATATVLGSAAAVPTT